MTAIISAKEQGLMERWTYLRGMISEKRFSFIMMDDLAYYATNTELNPKFAVPMETFKESVDCLIEAAKTVDTRTLTYYLKTFKAIFMRVADFDAAMAHVYSMAYFREAETGAGVPSMKKNYRDFDVELEGLLAAVDAGIGSNIVALTKQLGFFLTIAPKPVSRAILQHIIRVKTSLPAFIELFRHTPAFFRLRALTSGMDGLVMVGLLRHTLTNDWQTFGLDLTVNRETFAELILELTCTKTLVNCKPAADGRGPAVPVVVGSKPAILNATILLRELVIELLPNFKLQQHTSFILGLLNKILALEGVTGAGSTRVWIIDWKRGDDQGSLDIVDILNELYILAEAKKVGKDAELCALIAESFFLLEEKLKADNVSLTEHTTEAIARTVGELHAVFEKQQPKKQQQPAVKKPPKLLNIELPPPAEQQNPATAVQPTKKKTSAEEKPAPPSKSIQPQPPKSGVGQQGGGKNASQTSAAAASTTETPKQNSVVGKWGRPATPLKIEAPVTAAVAKPSAADTTIQPPSTDRPSPAGKKPDHQVKEATTAEVEVPSSVKEAAQAEKTTTEAEKIKIEVQAPEKAEDTVTVTSGDGETHPAAAAIEVNAPATEAIHATEAEPAPETMAEVTLEEAAEVPAPVSALDKIAEEEESTEKAQEVAQTPSEHQAVAPTYRPAFGRRSEFAKFQADADTAGSGGRFSSSAAVPPERESSNNRFNNSDAKVGRGGGSWSRGGAGHEAASQYSDSGSGGRGHYGGRGRNEGGGRNFGGGHDFSSSARGGYRGGGRGGGGQFVRKN